MELTPTVTRAAWFGAARHNQLVGLFFDPATTPDPERDDKLRAAQVELRPAGAAAWLGLRSSPVPSVAPIAISAPVGFSDVIACAFCETAAPTREFIRDQGWPAVDLIARTTEARHAAHQPSIAMVRSRTERASTGK